MYFTVLIESGDPGIAPRLSPQRWRLPFLFALPAALENWLYRHSATLEALLII